MSTGSLEVLSSSTKSGFGLDFTSLSTTPSPGTSAAKPKLLVPGEPK